MGSSSCAASTTITSVSLPISHTLFSTWNESPSRLNVPAVVSRSIVAVIAASPSSQHHHRPQDLPSLHLVKRLLHVVERDPLAHERVEGQSVPLPQVHQEREVAGRQAVAVPRGLELPTAAEDLDEGQL